jgi:hypothetical protein
MKRFTILKSFLLLCALIAGAGTAWATDKWVKTAPEDLATGDIVVIVDQTTSKAMSNNNGTSSAPSATDVTLNTGKDEITSEVASTLQWKVTVTTSSGTRSYQFGVSGTSNYLYCTNTNNGVRVGTDSNNAFTYEKDESSSSQNKTDYYLKNTATSRYIGVYDSQDWRCYTSIGANISKTHTAFYKKVSEGPAVMPTEGVEDWNITSGQYKLGTNDWTDIPTTEPAKVAFDGDDVYIQMTISGITLTIKGVKSGNTVTFPKNQTVAYSMLTLYLIGTTDGTTASDIVFNYDSGAKTLTQVTSIVASMTADGVSSAIATIKDVVLQKAASASSTIYSWDGSGSTSTANETGGKASAKGGNSNIVVGASQKGNWCLKFGKGFENANYIEIALDQALVGGETLTIGAFLTSSSAAVLGVDFGTTATQITKSDLYVLENNGVPSDWELTVPAAAAGKDKIRLYRNSGSATVWVSKVVVSSESTGSGTNATWSLDPTSAVVSAGKSTTLQLTTNYDGALTFESSDESIATVSYNSSTKVITVTGKAAGETTITVTGAATATYNAINKAISVTVNHSELESNFTDVLGPLGYSYFALTPKGSDTYAQPDVTSTDKTDSYGLQISFAKADGTLPRFDSNYTRLYKNNTLTITAPSNSYITKVVFTEPTTEEQWKGTMTVEEGDYVNSEKTWYATSTGITSIVFTGKDDTKRIGGIKVYLMATSIQATVSAAGWATWVAPVNVTVPSGAEAYAVALNGIHTDLTALTAIPAGTPVLLKNEGTYQFPVTTETPAAVTTALKVSEGTAVANAYVLAKKNDVVGFYKWIGTDPIPAGKVYLVYTASSAPDFIGFGDATGISSIENGQVTIDNSEVYNLAGQRVAQPTKGLYIINGKKYVVK